MAGDAGRRPDVCTRFLITATGFLSQPHTRTSRASTPSRARSSTPPRGTSDYDPTGRRIGLIGTGATAVQLIPELAKEGHGPDGLPAHRDLRGAQTRLRLSGWVRHLFARVPLTQRAVGESPTSSTGSSTTSCCTSARHCSNGSGSRGGRRIKMYRFAVIRDKELRRRLTRTTTSAVNDRRSPNSLPHVHQRRTFTCSPPVSSTLEPHAIVVTTAPAPRSTPWFAAAGFTVGEANIPAIEIIGRGGRNLGKWWRGTGSRPTRASRFTSPTISSLASPYAFIGLELLHTMGIRCG